MTVCSAPGKVYLFGEHAVVYGEPAVPCAIERRARVSVEQRADDRLRVHAEDLSLDGFTVEYDGSTDDRPDVDVSESLPPSSRLARLPAPPRSASTSPSRARFRSGLAWARRRRLPSLESTLPRANSVSD